MSTSPETTVALEPAVPCLDLTTRAWMRTVGRFTIYGTWFRHDNKQREPCLAIVPSRGPIIKPAVVLLSQAYLFDSPRTAAALCTRFVNGMGMPSADNAIKLFDLVNDHLSDLISLPPDPRERIVVADATVKLSTGETRTMEMRE